MQEQFSRQVHSYYRGVMDGSCCEAFWSRGLPVNWAESDLAGHPRLAMGDRNSCCITVVGGV